MRNMALLLGMCAITVVMTGCGKDIGGDVDTISGVGGVSIERGTEDSIEEKSELEEEFISAMEKGNTEDVMKIYIQLKYAEDNIERVEEELSNYLIATLKLEYDKYALGKSDSKTINLMLKNIKELGIRENHEVDKIEELMELGNSYEKALDYLDNREYEIAIDLLKTVPKDDINYREAVEKYDYYLKLYIEDIEKEIEGLELYDAILKIENLNDRYYHDRIVAILDRLNIRANEFIGSAVENCLVELHSEKPNLDKVLNDIELYNKLVPGTDDYISIKNMATSMRDNIINDLEYMRKAINGNSIDGRTFNDFIVMVNEGIESEHSGLIRDSLELIRELSRNLEKCKYRIDSNDIVTSDSTKELIDSVSYLYEKSKKIIELLEGEILEELKVEIKQLGEYMESMEG